MSNTAITPAVRKFLAQHATTVEYRSQSIAFTAHNGRRGVICLNANGSLDTAYMINRHGDFGPGASTLTALAQRVA